MAAETIHSIDPLAKIITPSFSGQNQGMKRLAAYLSAGGGRYADVIGFHFYQVSRISPEDLPSFVRQVRDVTKRFGMEAKPIWNTESGLTDSTRKLRSCSAFGAKRDGLTKYRLAGRRCGRSCVAQLDFGCCQWA